MTIRHTGLRFRPRTVDEYDMLYYSDPVEDNDLDVFDEYDKRKEIVQRVLMQSAVKKDDKKDTEEK